MAKKTEVLIHTRNNAEPFKAIVYVEGPLYTWQEEGSGWLVGHVATGLPCCADMRWKQKRDALDYLIKMLDSGINWNFKTEEECFEKNTWETITEAHKKAL